MPRKKTPPPDTTSGKKPKKKYVRRTFTFQGHRYEAKGETEAQAYEKLGRLKAAVERGEVGISSNMTVRAWVETYIATYVTPRIRKSGEPKQIKKSLTQKSAQMYSEKLNGYIVKELGGLPLKAVTATHLQRIVNSQAGKSFSHVNKLMTVTHMLFHRAYLDRLIPFDPSEDLTMPNVSRKTRRSLTAQELEVLEAVAATHPHGLWVRFHLKFGTREGEVPPLMVKNLDFTRHVLRVDQAVESGTGAVKDPKTAAGTRDIPIPLDFEPELKVLVAGKGPFDYLFPSQEGGMMTQSGINRRWRSFKRAMDIAMGAKVDRYGKVKPETSRIASDLTLHCLRHTYCTDLGAKGVDASIGRLVTGHADVATLSNIYTHSNDTIVQMIARKINGLPDDDEAAQAEGR